MGEPQPSWFTPEAWRLRTVCVGRKTRAERMAHRFAWAQRVLWWRLDANQLRLYQKLKHNGRKRKVLNCSRRIGKTYMLAADADEYAWHHPKARIIFAAPTLKDLEDIVIEAFEEWLADCPEDLRPRWLPTKKRYVYPNGAEIRLVGCDDRRKANRARGRAIHRVYIEEAGSNPVLKYLIGSILAPTLLSTGGEMWIASSPPDTEEHEFATIVRAAEEQGVLTHCEIWDCPRYTKEEVMQFIREAADLMGASVAEYMLTAEYRREFLGQLVTDPALAVLPAATPERMEGKDGTAPAVVREMPDTPLFRDRWVSMDLGFHPHFTHLLFGYWDFARQVLVIEDEAQQQRLHDAKLARLIAGAKDKAGEWLLDDEGKPIVGKEHELWGDEPPFMRVADNNYPMTLAELSMTHGIVFVPTAKDEKEAAILHVNRWVREGKIAVHPRCKQLISQMKGAIWNKHRTEFARQPNGGHFDAVDALIYLVRNVIPHASREPPGWGFNHETMHRSTTPQDPDLAALRRAFGG